MASSTTNSTAGSAYSSSSDPVANITKLGPLHFCMITTFYPPFHFGGDAVFVQRLAMALAVRGHRVTVIHCLDAYRLLGGTETEAPPSEHPNITVHSLSSALGALSPLLTHQLASPALKAVAIKKVLEQETFDVIHFHNVSLIGGPKLLGYSTGNAKTVKLYTAHEYWLLCPLSTLWKYDREPCEQRECTRCTLHARRPPQWWRNTSVLEKNLQHLDALISPSQFVIQQHRAMGFTKHFDHIPNFLPLAQRIAGNTSNSNHSDGDKPFFLAVGRLEKSKGFQQLVNFFRDFQEADLVIAGQGPYGATLKEMARDSSNIQFLGQIPYKRLEALYQNVVAVIVPSLWHEPFGLIVLEAFAKSTPVVVHNAGALPELVKLSKGGLVYQNDAELKTALETLLQDSAQRDVLGRHGREAYERLWTEEQHLEQYFSLIASKLPQ